MFGRGASIKGVCGPPRGLRYKAKSGGACEAVGSSGVSEIGTNKVNKVHIFEIPFHDYNKEIFSRFVDLTLASKLYKK